MAKAWRTPRNGENRLHVQQHIFAPMEITDSYERQEVIDLLGSIPLVQQLPAGSVQKITQVIKCAHYRSGEAIVREGDAGEGLYIVWKGEAAIASSGGTDRLDYTPLLKSGDYFGNACAGPAIISHRVDINAVTEVTCLILEHKHADLLAACSIWKSQAEADGPAPIERILDLESLEVDIFRAVATKDKSYGQIFGGQLIGQALAAASKSVDPAIFVHSLHSYFLRRGDESLPIIYRVERTRDGQSYATRHVSAIQRGVVIYVMYASFQRPEDGVEHQIPMPSAPDPEQVASNEAVKASYRTDARIPLHVRKRIEGGKPGPIDVRRIEPVDYVNPKKMEARHSMWVRARGKLSDDRALHACVAGYASDMGLMDVVLRPHGLLLGRDTYILSLDHTMWFHKAFRADEWLLMVVDSPRAAGGRGLTRASLYTQSGELVITIAQEGVVRILDKSKRKSKL